MAHSPERYKKLKAYKKKKDKSFGESTYEFKRRKRDNVPQSIKRLWSAHDGQYPIAREEEASSECDA